MSETTNDPTAEADDFAAMADTIATAMKVLGVTTTGELIAKINEEATTHE